MHVCYFWKWFLLSHNCGCSDTVNSSICWDAPGCTPRASVPPLCLENYLCTNSVLPQSKTTASIPPMDRKNESWGHWTQFFEVQQYTAAMCLPYEQQGIPTTKMVTMADAPIVCGKTFQQLEQAALKAGDLHTLFWLKSTQYNLSPPWTHQVMWGNLWWGYGWLTISLKHQGITGSPVYMCVGLTKGNLILLSFYGYNGFKAPKTKCPPKGWDSVKWDYHIDSLESNFYGSPDAWYFFLVSSM